METRIGYAAHDERAGWHWIWDTIEEARADFEKAQANTRLLDELDCSRAHEAGLYQVRYTENMEILESELVLWGDGETMTVV